MDDLADVVGRDDVPDGDLAAVEIDVDRRDTRRPTECGIGVAVVGRVVEVDAGVGLELLIDAGGAMGGGVVAENRGKVAAVVALLDLRPEPAGRVDQQPTDDHRRPAGDRRPRVRHDRRVLRRDLDVLVRDAELRGDELREDRLRPLPHLR